VLFGSFVPGLPSSLFAYVLDAERAAFVAVDLATGDRLIRSK
jgi:hypothetical protein